MGFDTSKQWEPTEWQDHVNGLLRLRHLGDKYIPVPDDHTGDSGIEGYSVDGNAYQSYAPDEMCSISDLAKKQKDKISRDIAKFIGNKAKLGKLIYETKIRNWVLVVPRHVSQEVLIHANEKANEVRASGLPYVDSEQFRVLVRSRDDFAAEEKALIQQQIEKIHIENVEATDDDVLTFEEKKLDLINTLVEKLGKLPKADASALDEAKSVLVRRFIASENILQRLREDYPEHYEWIETFRARREGDLILESLTEIRPSLTDQAEHLLPKLEEYGVLHPDHNNMIAWGTVSDWLMRCPLDFK